MRINRIRENLSSELKAVAQQTISTIKEELAAVISNKIVSQRISEALTENSILKKWMKCVYGKKRNVEIIVSENPANPICFIKLHLKPMELVILKNY